jgi:PAS domain S-box-containing protein
MDVRPSCRRLSGSGGAVGVGSMASSAAFRRESPARCWPLATSPASPVDSDLVISTESLEPRSDSSSEIDRLRRENAALRAQVEELGRGRAELLHKSAALRTVLSSIPYSVFWKDRNSVFLGCNQSLATMAGLDHPDQIVGETDYDMPWTREEADSYRTFDRQVIDKGQLLTNIEEHLVDSEGKLKVVLTSKVPLRDEGGNVMGMVGIFTDITPRKLMELELHKAKEVAEAADRAKGDFLATVSHELRTPLAMILGPLEQVVNRKDLPERDRKDTARALRNAWRLKNLVDDILEFTKGAARMKTPSPEAVDVVELTRALVEEAQAAAENRGLTLELIAPPALPLLLDLHMYERIALNLIGNALKFTPAGGRIDVLIHDRGEAFELAVRDTGIGIEPNDQVRLFQRFQQVDTSSTRRYQGTGLGLALVKQFAELLDGTVTVQSAPGEGSCFAVVLPKRDPANTPRLPALMFSERSARAARIAVTGAHATLPSSLTADLAAEAAAVAAAVADPSRPTVALVEDNTDLRVYAVEVLSERYNVIPYRNGATAIEGIRAYQPDVVVSDVMMPGLDGHQLVTALKASAELRHIPVILLTAQAGREVLVASLEGGADDFLNKPFSAPELVARVGAAVRLSKAYQELRQRNRELMETRDMLIEAEKLSALGRMLTQLSHEINNPMTVIVGNLPSAMTNVAALSEMLAAYRAASPSTDASAGAGASAGATSLEQLRSTLDIDFIVEDFPALLASVQEAAERVQHIQDDLRSFLRGEPLEQTSGDLNVGLRATVEMMRRGLPPDIQIDATYGVLPPAHYNAGQIKQVILNLLQNAIDAVRPRGLIEVRSSAGPSCVTISVTNDGPIIPLEVRRKIFEPFFTTKDLSKGSGIGLAVCRQILTRHGGKIWLDEQRPTGARFVIELPHGAAPGGPT